MFDLLSLGIKCIKPYERLSGMVLLSKISCKPTHACLKQLQVLDNEGHMNSIITRTITPGQSHQGSNELIPYLKTTAHLSCDNSSHVSPDLLRASESLLSNSDRLVSSVIKPAIKIRCNLSNLICFCSDTSVMSSKTVYTNSPVTLKKLSRHTIPNLCPMGIDYINIIPN